MAINHATTIISIGETVVTPRTQEREITEAIRGLQTRLPKKTIMQFFKQVNIFRLKTLRSDLKSLMLTNIAFE